MNDYGLWLSAAGMKVNDHRQDVLAHNMANIETAGFKRDLAAVWERPVESKTAMGGADFAHEVLDHLSGGMSVQQTYTDFSIGAMDRTERALDVAIQGEGFFQVKSGNVTRLTRDGRFVMDPEGNVSLASGGGAWKVLDRSGELITLDRNGDEPIISANGTIKQNGEEIGQLSLKRAVRPQDLRKFGETLFDAAGEMADAETTLLSGWLERSNVDPTTTLVDLMEVSRAYEVNARLLQLQDESTGRVISQVGQAV